MQLRYLEYFVALARERHFARAAESCHVAQPTLSAGLAALEEMLGQRLVIRDRRFIDLSPEGYAVLPFAQQMLADQQAMRSALNSDAGPLRGTLRLGAIPAAMPSVGCLVKAIAAAHQGLQVNVRSMTSREIEQGLVARDLDAGITYLSSEPPAQVRSVALYSEHFIFATHKDGPCADQASITLAQAAETRLCLLHEGMQNRRILNACLAKRGLSVEPVATADSYVALLAMVSDGGLSAIITDSHSAMVSAHPNLLLLPISDDIPANQVGLVIIDREPLSPLARAAFAISGKIGFPSPLMSP
jgi:DNA-binding transcriptional LysR family regulator